MIAVLAVNQNGPNRERRYLCRMSFHPSVVHNCDKRRPDVTSAAA